LGSPISTPDPKAGGAGARLRFAIAAHGDSFEDIPPAPPSLSWIQEVDGRAE
jgi:hypothetical protein